MGNSVPYGRSLLRALAISLALSCAATSFFCSLGNSSDTQGANPRSEAGASSPAKGSGPQPSDSHTSQVTIYVTSWCPACRMAIDFFKKEGIPHVVKDIEKNPAYLDEMIQKAGGNRGVPVIDVNGKILLGFNPYIIKEMLH
jgi:glutaredoxin 3